MSHSKTQKLVYSSVDHLHERCRIKVYVHNKQHINEIRGIEEINRFAFFRSQVKRRQIYFASCDLIDKIILKHKENLVLRRKRNLC